MRGHQLDQKGTAIDKGGSHEFWLIVLKNNGRKLNATILHTDSKYLMNHSLQGNALTIISRTTTKPSQQINQTNQKNETMNYEHYALKL